MNRQIILDTETTGLKHDEGHRVIEIGAIELIDRKFTGRTFHHYINPQREIDAGAIAIHGITNEFLQDKPLFSDLAVQMMEFLDGAELIIHNAPFDVGFLNAELKRLILPWRRLENHCQIFDTLLLARKLHVGQKNNLDALCKRYFVDNTKREYHGALLDANLLAHVYLAMTGGQGNFFDTMVDTVAGKTVKDAATVIATDQYNLPVIVADNEEAVAHDEYLLTMQKKGSCLWLDLEKSELALN